MKNREDESMRFSIIIPNYNKEEYLKKCLDSVFNQTIDPSKYEVLFIDDGSTDNSLEIVKNYNVKLFYTNRKMAGGARNKGIDNANGEYLLFLDSDDFLYSNDVLEKLDKHITGEDLVNLCFMREYQDGVKMIDDFALSLPEKIEKSTLLACYTRCFKKEFLTNIRFIEECYYEDVDFMLEVLCNVRSMSDFKEPFIFYRYVSESITKTKQISAKKMTDVFLQIARLYYLCDQFPQYSKQLLNRIQHDRLNDRLKILNQYFETGYNSFYDHFKTGNN